MMARLGVILGTAPIVDDDPEDYLAGSVVERYSKKQVVDAGKAIKAAHPTHTDELVAAYKIAHAWRNGHLSPMRRVRSELSAKAGKISRTAVTAGRLKRFQSIRRKLKRGNITLYQMQDIAGARAIMETQRQVELLAAIYREGGSKYEVFDEDDYIANPKRDGYRSHHLILKFDGSEDITGGNRLTVELQIRTKLQHAWATAVEAVGLVRGENLKAGQGSADWLRFFVLVSAEFAAEEQAAMVPGVPENAAERQAELREIADRLDAVQTLESYNQAIYQTEGYLGLKGKSYLILFDVETKKVTVRTYSPMARMSEGWFNEEMFNDQPNIVLVEIDKVDDLRSAYPNYFLDVRLFTNRLKAIVLKPEAMPLPGAKPRKWGKFLDFLKDYEPSRRRSD